MARDAGVAALSQVRGRVPDYRLEYRVSSSTACSEPCPDGGVRIFVPNLVCIRVRGTSVPAWTGLVVPLVRRSSIHFPVIHLRSLLLWRRNDLFFGGTAFLDAGGGPDIAQMELLPLGRGLGVLDLTLSHSAGHSRLRNLCFTLDLTSASISNFKLTIRPLLLRPFPPLPPTPPAPLLFSLLF